MTSKPPRLQVEKIIERDDRLDGGGEDHIAMFLSTLGQGLELENFSLMTPTEAQAAQKMLSAKLEVIQKKLKTIEVLKRLRR